MSGIGLYVHIPFCQAKCFYCDFASFPKALHQAESYLDALEKEVKASPTAKIETMFIGGGTPTVLNPSQIQRLFRILKSHFDFSSLVEATVEGNPESATRDVLSAYLNEGINRISFGLQTTDPQMLRALGRIHDQNDFEKAYSAAASLGCSNINIDLMFGLPGQTREMWTKTLEDVVTYNSSHISAYALKVEGETVFSDHDVQVDEDLEADMYMAASQFLTESGYSHYEISNFACPGKECRHNLKYWLNHDSLGFGVSAASFFQGRRWTNTSQLRGYIERMSAGQSVQEEETVLPHDDQFRENIMLRLRLKEGASASEVSGLGNPLFSNFQEQGLAFHEKGMYCLTPKGWLLSNQLFQTLI